jgi:hypothetical protein
MIPDSPLSSASGALSSPYPYMFVTFSVTKRLVYEINEKPHFPMIFRFPRKKERAGLTVSKSVLLEFVRPVILYTAFFEIGLY